MFVCAGVALCVRRCIQLEQDGSTALIIAAANGHADCVRLLLDAGADANARDGVREAASNSTESLFFAVSWY